MQSTLAIIKQAGLNRLRNVIFVAWIAASVFISGCASDQVISQRELRLQDAAATEVASVLFEKEMDSLASYNVRRDGFVVIKFDQSVPFDRYNDVVATLRSNKAILGVYAEQGGKQVCPRP